MGMRGEVLDGISKGRKVDLTGRWFGGGAEAEVVDTDQEQGNDGEEQAAVSLERPQPETNGEGEKRQHQVQPEEQLGASPGDGSDGPTARRAHAGIVFSRFGLNLSVAAGAAGFYGGGVWHPLND
jgi:hypothetical protein